MNVVSNRAWGYSFDAGQTHTVIGDFEKFFDGVRDFFDPQIALSVLSLVIIFEFFF